MLRSRSGTEFDPTLVQLCTRENGALLDGLDRVDAWQQVIDGCAALDRPIADDELTDVLTVVADYSDAKATWFLGHSRAVADLAATAAREYGLPVHRGRPRSGDRALPRPVRRSRRFRRRRFRPRTRRRQARDALFGPHPTRQRRYPRRRAARLPHHRPRRDHRHRPVVLGLAARRSRLNPPRTRVGSTAHPARRSTAPAAHPR